jgi:hypothetical protein
VPRAKLACGRVGNDVDGMVVQPDRLALRLLSGPADAWAASWCICMARGIVSPSVMVEAFVPQACAACHGAHPSRSQGGARAGRRLVRGRDLSCEAETCHARRRLVGGGPSHRELVGDATS